MGEQRKEVMNQNEILKNITSGFWYLRDKKKDKSFIATEDKTLADIIALSPAHEGHPNSQKHWEANAAAICNAVNNTYGAGIDPTKVPEMVALLQEISNMHPDGNPAKMIQKAQSLLTSAKLDK